MKKLKLAITLLALGSLSMAQTSRLRATHPQVSPQQEAASQFSKKNALATMAPNAPDDNTCFTTGAGNTFLQFCVTVNGNIVQIESPQGVPLISSDHGEGYGFCDLATETSYHDYASFGDSGNMQPAITLSHTAKSVKIARTTSDGMWTLTQTISLINGISPSVRITMALKNNTPGARTAALVRYADVDAAGVLLNNFDDTLDSAFGYNSIDSTLPYGLVLQNLGTVPSHHLGLVIQNFQPPDACGPFNGVLLNHLEGVDGSLRHAYDFTSIPKLGSFVVTLEYKSL